jgi:hypothetical protein
MDYVAHGLSEPPSLASPVLEVMSFESPAQQLEAGDSAHPTTMGVDQATHVNTSRGASPEGMQDGIIPMSPTSFLASNPYDPDLLPRQGQEASTQGCTRPSSTQALYQGGGPGATP